MHLVDNIPPEVYKAYFPRSLAANQAVSLASGDAGSEHNYKKWPPAQRSEYFPSNVVCAEDPDWDRVGLTPPRLTACCIRSLARFFSLKPAAGCSLTGGDRAKFLNLLSTKEPILLTAERIPDEIYWQRCCKEILPTCDTANHGGSFKRLFLEKHLQSCIEKYVPLQTDMYDVKDLLGTFEPYIKRLEITELLPPTLLLIPGRDEDFEEGEEGENSEATNVQDDNTIITAGSGSQAGSSSAGLGSGGPPLPPEINMKIPSNHFDFGAIFPQLNSLEEFHVVYKVKHCGTDFRWNMFGMTLKDADNLANGLKICKKLKVIRIHNSKVDDDKFYAIYDGIKSLQTLEVLSLENNTLTDESAESFARLLSGPSIIKVLDITNNRLSDKGAKQLSQFLASPQAKGKLETLNLSLNTITDQGCRDLTEAISNNPTMSTLDLSSNYLTSESGPYLKNMICRSPGLRSLNVSCNPLGNSGGMAILDGVKATNRLNKVDIRLTGCGRDVDLSIQEILRKNRFAKRPPLASTSSRSSSPASSGHGHSHSHGHGHGGGSGGIGGLFGAPAKKTFAWPK